MVISKRAKTDGFTLVELMLAMAFLSAVLLFAILTFVQALAIYNKGIAVSQINETGRSLTNDLSRSTNNATSFSVAPSPSPQFMCIGKTAYLWNLYNTSDGNKYRIGGPSGDPIGMVRTNDSVDGRKYCSTNPAARSIIASEVTSLIGSQVKVLDVQAVSQNQALPVEQRGSIEAPLIKFSLTIGTKSEDGQGDPVIEPGNTYWSCPAGAFGTFCAVGTYSTIIYVPSGS